MATPTLEEKKAKILADYETSAARKRVVETMDLLPEFGDIFIEDITNMKRIRLTSEESKEVLAAFRKLLESKL